MIYAQINEQGYCVGISELSGKVEHQNLIQIESLDTSYIARRYDRKNKVWSDEYVVNDEVTEESLTELELLGQQFSDLEIQQLEYNMEATQERQFLGQQLSDLEILTLERGL